MADMVLLSFDTEEFDLPREYGADITLDEGMSVSSSGILRVLDCLSRHGVVATFFCTGNFARLAPQVMQRIVGDGHEVACHGVDHLHPAADDYANSKLIVEHVAGQIVTGYREPRMTASDNAALARLGYTYNSSLNPTFIPGRYCHLTVPRTWHYSNGVMQIPASVTPWLRLPLFWLTLHHMPVWLYRRMVRRVLRHDGYVATYFHPWEFYPLQASPHYQVPWYIARRCGDPMLQRFENLITWLKGEGQTFVTYGNFCEQMRGGKS